MRRTSRIFNEKIDETKIFILVKNNIYSSLDYDLILY